MAASTSVAWELSSSDGDGSGVRHERSNSVPANPAYAYEKLLPTSLYSDDEDDSDSDIAAPHALRLTPFDARVASSDAIHQDVASMTFDHAVTSMTFDHAVGGSALFPPHSLRAPFESRPGSHMHSIDDDAGVVDLRQKPRRRSDRAYYARVDDADGDDDSDSCDDAGKGGLEGACAAESPAKGKSSRALAVSRLKKGWKAVKRTGAKGTASAGKSLSNLSSTYWKHPPPVTRQASAQASTDREEWLSSVLPAWNKKRRTARTRCLLFRGVPSSVRGLVWRTALGNPLNVSAELFEILKERARVGRAEYMRGKATLDGADGDVGGIGGQAEGMLDHERSAHKAILLDLPRTFPELAFFHAKDSPYEDALRDILEAFVYLRPDVGYSQGMSFLGAVLLLFMEPADAFACFVTMLLYKSCFLQFFRIQMPDVRIYLNVHQRLLAEEMPALHAHFNEQHVEADLYMINWVMSLYCRALPLDLVSRIWDIYVVDGDVAIFRAALGILKFFQQRLLAMNFEEIAYMLSHLPVDEINENGMMHSIRSVRCVTRKHFKDVFRECEKDYTDPFASANTSGNAGDK